MTSYAKDGHLRSTDPFTDWLWYAMGTDEISYSEFLRLWEHWCRFKASGAGSPSAA